MCYIYNLFVLDNLCRYKHATPQGSHPFALSHSSLFSSFVYCSRHLFNFRFSSLHLNTTIQPCSFAHFANAVVVMMRMSGKRERENVKKRRTGGFVVAFLQRVPVQFVQMSFLTLHTQSTTTSSILCICHINLYICVLKNLFSLSLSLSNRFRVL